MITQRIFKDDCTRIISFTGSQSIPLSTIPQPFISLRIIPLPNLDEKGNLNPNTNPWGIGVEE